MAAIADATGWRASFESFDGSLVAVDPSPGSGVRIVGRTGAEVVERIRAYQGERRGAALDRAELDRLGDELAGALLDRDAAELRAAALAAELAALRATSREPATSAQP
jgi:hypothetical protein